MEDTPVAVIVGPRQCGKSTLAAMIASERGARQVTLDDAGPRAAANADPTGFVEQLEPPAIIDEFQKAAELLPAIKSRVDRARSGGRRATGMFLLTGSANVWATLQISRSPWPAARSESSSGRCRRERSTVGERRSSTGCWPARCPESRARTADGQRFRGPW